MCNSEDKERGRKVSENRTPLSENAAEISKAGQGSESQCGHFVTTISASPTDG
jgi:hypothetical protein